MGNHALLSASSSHRWLNCPPSARLGENYEDKGSDFAAEGTDAHSLCEHKLKTALGIPSEDPTENLTWYNEEMEECASGYAAYVLELLAEAKKVTTDPIVLIEQRLDYAEEGLSGTQAESRPQFMKMIEDCRSGLIDCIRTKAYPGSEGTLWIRLFTPESFGPWALMFSSRKRTSTPPNPLGNSCSR